MNSPQKILAGLGCAFLLSCAFLMYVHFSVSENRDFCNRELEDLKNIQSIGELIYQHQRLIAEQNKVIDTDKKGEFSEGKVAELMNKHNLSSKSARNKDSSSKNKKSTFTEMQYNYTFQDEALKNVIEFLLEVESLGNVTVRDLRISRNPKNKDLWSSSFTFVLRLKKEDPKT